MGDLHSIEIAEILTSRRYQKTDSERGLLARLGRSDSRASRAGTSFKIGTSIRVLWLVPSRTFPTVLIRRVPTAIVAEITFNANIAENHRLRCSDTMYRMETRCRPRPHLTSVRSGGLT